MELFTVETCGADKSLNALRADRSGATEAFREDGADTGRCAETAHREADRQRQSCVGGRAFISHTEALWKSLSSC